MKKCFFGFLATLIILSFFTSAILANENAPRTSFMKLPLSFIKNDGPKDSSILYYEQGNGHTTSFAKGGISFAISRLSKFEDKHDAPEVVTLTPLNASPFTIEPIDKRDGKINYLIGNDPKKWKINIPTYGAIVYKNIYPGIDMKFYGTNSQLEYDIIVAPHADPSKVHLSYKGIERLSITPSGDLELTLKEGSLLQKRPTIYQTINNTRKEIEGKFILAGTTYSFEVGPYDKNHPLIIDPVIVFSSYLGGTGSDIARGIAIDSSGNIYVTGGTSSTDFPILNSYQNTYGGIFVAKLNPSGNEILYSTYIGGSGSDHVRGISVDASGNAYIAGFTSSTDFPTNNAYQESSGGQVDAFVTKLNASGNTLLYSTYLGGTEDDEVFALAIDSSGNAYVTGYTYSYNFPTKNPFQETKDGTSQADVFVTKLHASGITLVYSTYLGGSGSEVAHAITVDSSGHAYVAGGTRSTDFPIKNAFQGSFAGCDGCHDAFITKFYPLGNALVYSTYLGGSGTESADAIAVDSSGNVYVTGSTASIADFPTQNPVQATNAGTGDVFLTKLDTTGNALLYSTYIGGSGFDGAYAIAVDSWGNAYIAGHTWSTDFPTQNPLQVANAGGVYDAFITKFGPTGNTLVYSTYLGGSNSDHAHAIATDPSGNVYVAGFTDSADFPTKNPYQETNTGEEAFIVKLSSDNYPSYRLVVNKIGSGSGTVISNPSGINCGLDCTEMYLKDDIVALTASTEDDSIFTGWSGGGCSGTDNCVVTMKANAMITVAFVLPGAPPELSSTEGTIGTQIIITGSGFGSKRGRVHIGGIATKIAKDGWTDKVITCTISKALPEGGPYHVMIRPYKADDITIPNAFTMKPPEIDYLDFYNGVAGVSSITITGKFFGTKKGKVYLDYEDKYGKLKKKNCKVKSWGMESITFIVPKTSKSSPAGTYPLKVTNKVGTAGAPSDFTID